MIARYSALGLTNEQMKENPVWVDKTGNGHDLQMKNFAWKEGSGISDVYPGALVFDGVDDYGVCDNFPILTKEKGYTIVALRQYLDESASLVGLVSNTKNWFSDGAFIFEYRNLKSNNINSAVSFGTINIDENKPNVLSYQTSKSYNGKAIGTGNFVGSDFLSVCKLEVGTPDFNNVAIWEICILDHDATEEELQKIQDYYKQEYPWLFPDQAWTVTGKTNEDEDRATIANITGNGNDLVLSNFGFAEGSGYGLYAYNFNSFTLKGNEVKPTDVKNDSFRIVGTGNGSNVSVLSNTSNSANWKIRVTGMKEGDNLIVGNANKSGDYFTITKDGIYTFQKQYEASSTNGVWYNSAQETDVLVEQIPEYEGYLVTDGVDDSGRAVNVTISKDFTLVGEWILFSKTSVNAGLSIHPQIHIFNRPEVIQIIFRSAGKTLPVKSLKAICSDGRCYDKDWSELKINVGEFTDNRGILFVASNGTNYAQIAFKNLGIYNNQLLSKDDCIKAYNYLQTLKAK